MQAMPAFLARGILYIDPSRVDELIIDDHVRKISGLLTLALSDPDKVGCYYYMEPEIFVPRVETRGTRICTCGASTTTQAYEIGRLDGRAIVTNRLAAHYLAYHRRSVPKKVIALIGRLDGEFREPAPDILQAPGR